MSFFDRFKKKKDQAKVLPPIPEWRPKIIQPLETVIDTIKYYSDGKIDFAVFQNGTVVLVPDGLDDREVEHLAKESLHNVFYIDPDMRPQEMDDGNILVGYSYNVANVVLNNVAEEHWDAINNNHQKALATSEVLMTPLDEFSKKSLFGRCYMFMDAQNPKVVQVVRKGI